LKTCNTSITAMEKTIGEHTGKINETADALTTKADATVAFAVQTLDKDVLAIKNHLKKEEDQGISVSCLSYTFSSSLYCENNNYLMYITSGYPTHM
jgi:transcriptional regulator